MINRIDQNMSNTINENKKQIEDMKNRQIIGGDVFYNYVSSSPGTYDHSVLVPIYDYRDFYVDFTYDTPGKMQFVTLDVFIRIGNSNVMDSPYLYMANSTVNYVYTSVFSDNTKNTFIVETLNWLGGIDQTVYYKFYIRSSITGTISVRSV